MKRKIFLLAATALLNFGVRAQLAYDIKVNLKGCTDTVAYLAKYVFDQTYIADTCKTIRNGAIEFKGKEALETGVYILVNQDKAPFFEFLVNESQKFVINADLADMANSMAAPGNTENTRYFSYMKYGMDKNREFNDARLIAAAKNKKDSAKYMQDKIRQLEDDVKKFDIEFVKQVQGTFLYDYMNLKMEKMPTEVPKASNGRPDSIYQYYYYKNHYFDGVNFKDDRLARTPYFDDRIKKYFDNVIVNNPDSVNKEIDKLLSQTTEGSLVYKALIGYFTYKYEQSKIVGFDKVFLHMVDNYILAGKTNDLYSPETIETLRTRSAIMNPLLEGKKVPDLYMIDTLNAREVRKMGFDTASSAKSVTELYYKNQARLSALFKTLHQVNAKYTIVLFWAADCGHCQKEVPKLHESLKALKGKIDVKVFAVQTKDDQFDPWRRFLIEKKLTDFINVYDPVHINNTKEKFDVNATPVIYVLDRDKKIIAKKIDSEFVVDLIRSFDKQDKKP